MKIYNSEEEMTRAELSVLPTAPARDERPRVDLAEMELSVLPPATIKQSTIVRYRVIEGVDEIETK